MSGVDTIRASAVKPEAVRWLWEDRIPLGTLTLIAGRPGQGKSLLTAYLAAEVSKKGDVIFSNLEDSLAQVVRPRLQVAGAKLDRVHFWTPILPADVDALETKIRRLKAKLVILDPIAAHLTVAIYSDQDVRRALTPLTAMAARTGCAIVAVHHTVKNVSKNAHPLQAIGGSSGGLTGAARAVFIFGPSPVHLRAEPAGSGRADRGGGEGQPWPAAAVDRVRDGRGRVEDRQGRGLDRPARIPW